VKKDHSNNRKERLYKNLKNTLKIRGAEYKILSFVVCEMKMNSRIIILFTLGSLLLGSCVGNKRLVYLQDNDLKKEVPKEEVVRDYDLQFEDYRIQPQDILSVKFTSLTDDEFDVFQDFGMGGGMSAGGGAGNLALIGELVDPHGMISFPLVGKIKVQGKTIFEIQDTLQIIAAKYVEDPAVKVRLLNYRFTILGEVTEESVVTTQNTRTTFMEAIGMAGGLGELADRSKVKVIRQKGNQAEVFYLNLLDEDFINSEKFYVYQNDIIIVPPLKQRPIRKYYGQNLGLLLSSISAVVFIISLSNLN
jgi:polysaccharide export outer membrane protein